MNFTISQAKLNFCSLSTEWVYNHIKKYCPHLLLYACEGIKFQIIFKYILSHSFLANSVGIDSWPAKPIEHGTISNTTRQSEMADLARRATSVCTKFHRDRLRNGWDITLWNFAKTRTNTQTDMGITIPRPPPMGGEVISNHEKFIESVSTVYYVMDTLPGIHYGGFWNNSNVHRPIVSYFCLRIHEEGIQHGNSDIPAPSAPGSCILKIWFIIILGSFLFGNCDNYLEELDHDCGPEWLQIICNCANKY